MARYIKYASVIQGPGNNSVAGGDLLGTFPNPTIPFKPSSGLHASLPSAGTAGRIYLPTDGAHLLEDNGSSWAAFGPMFPQMTVPPTSGWSWVNQSTATLTTYGSAQTISSPGNAGSNVNMQVRSVASAPYTLTAYFQSTYYPANFCSGGLVLRESGSGKLVVLSFEWNTSSHVGPMLQWDKFNSPTSYNANYGGLDNYMTGGWLRIQDDNTNRKLYYSRDGNYFYLLQSMLRTDFITPDQYGWFIDLENNKAGAITLYSWNVTQP